MATPTKPLIAFILTVALGLPPTAGAAPVSITGADQREVMVTVYNGNLGLVKDVREIRLDAGAIEARFADVAAQIDPTSLHLRSLTDAAGLRILEQNYEYDLLSSEKLMEKYVGRKVRLYQGNGSYQEATLLSTRGPVYDINGQIHMGHFGSVVLPALPENLVSKPTLAWLLRNTRPTPQRVEASYLTGGISWKADYVMLINAADTRTDLTGWVTITNQSGATYRDTALKLVGLDGKGKRMPHELSGGEQQRVAIARAIVNKPQILLADEPTGNLDPVTSAGIMTLLERINAGGTTVVMATHEAGIVDQMQRRVIEL